MNFNSNRSYKHLNLAHAHNLHHYEFLLIHAIALKKLSNERFHKFSWILTLTEVISIRILRMRLISAFMNFYGSHAITLQKLTKELSYKVSWILTLTEAINIRILHMRIIYTIMNFHWSMLLPLKNCPMNVLIN